MSREVFSEVLSIEKVFWFDLSSTTVWWLAMIAGQIIEQFETGGLPEIGS